MTWTFGCSNLGRAGAGLLSLTPLANVTLLGGEVTVGGGIGASVGSGGSGLF